MALLGIWAIQPYASEHRNQWAIWFVISITTAKKAALMKTHAQGSWRKSYSNKCAWRNDSRALCHHVKQWDIAWSPLWTGLRVSSTWQSKGPCLKTWLWKACSITSSRERNAGLQRMSSIALRSSWSTQEIYREQGRAQAVATFNALRHMQKQDSTTNLPIVVLSSAYHRSLSGIVMWQSQKLLLWTGMPEQSSRFSHIQSGSHQTFTLSYRSLVNSQMKRPCKTHIADTLWSHDLATCRWCIRKIPCAILPMPLWKPMWANWMKVDVVYEMAHCENLPVTYWGQ